MTLVLRYMTRADIDQVVAIDQAVFSMPWLASSYAYEIGESPYSYMVVLEDTERQAVEPRKALWRWGNLTRRFIGSTKFNQNTRQILSYGGMWKIRDEAHISTLASHPDWQGKGYGELILAALIRRALVLQAEYIVLEVRVSNTVAQNLYRKYGFAVVNRKRRYYHDNGEDAYDMRLDLDEAAKMAGFSRYYATIKAHHVIVDKFTETPRPYCGIRHRIG